MKTFFSIFSLLLILVLGKTGTGQSEKIKVYFNNPVDNTVSPLVDAQNIEDFTDTIVAYINRAQSTMDVCNYNTGSSAIVNAINNAKNRGVIVRYIASHTTLGNNSELNNLLPSIPLIQRPNDGEVMHNKFIIFDSGDSNKARVLTGSANHTSKSLATDFNNIVIIQDKNLALAYKTEFEEMWGSSTDTPNPANAKFGSQKTDNTPHNFVVDGVNIELYFSPSDDTEGHIESAILSANKDIYFEMLTFTSNTLGDAIVNRLNNGVMVKGFIHNSSYFGSEYNKIVNAGANVTSTQTNLQITHNKYAIIDAGNINSDPITITGSHNWSNSAQNDYDENTLIIHDKFITHQYLEAFGARKPVTYTSIDESITPQLSIFPNPTNENITIINNNVSITRIDIYSLSGQLLKQYNNINLPKTIINLSSLNKGYYLIKTELKNGTIYTNKLSIQ